MKIYDPIGIDNCQLVHFVNGEDYELLASFDGTSRKQTWRPVRVKIVDYSPRMKSPMCDFPWLGCHPLILRTRAVMALRDIFDAYGELLPLATDDDVTLFVFNAWATDALDEARSELIRVPGSTQIAFIDKPVFIDDNVRGRDIIRPRGRAMPTYVSERFVERVERAGLVGLEFDLVATVS
ncbi:MAG: hypothetical protein Tsb0020_33090 [Haliangiales bacterium]